MPRDLVAVLVLSVVASCLIHQSKPIRIDSQSILPGDAGNGQATTAGSGTEGPSEHAEDKQQKRPLVRLKTTLTEMVQARPGSDDDDGDDDDDDDAASLLVMTVMMMANVMVMRLVTVMTVMMTDGGCVVGGRDTRNE